MQNFAFRQTLQTCSMVNGRFMLEIFPQCKFSWNFQKYSVKITCAFIDCVRDFQDNALWDTQYISCLYCFSFGFFMIDIWQIKKCVVHTITVNTLIKMLATLTQISLLLPPEILHRWMREGKLKIFVDDQAGNDNINIVLTSIYWHKSHLIKMLFWISQKQQKKHSYSAK